MRGPRVGHRRGRLAGRTGDRLRTALPIFPYRRSGNRLEAWLPRCSRSKTSTWPWKAPRSSRGVDLTSAPGRCTPSWGPTARASRRSPTPCSATRPTEVTAGRIRFKGEDVTDWPPDVRGKAGMFLAFQYPEEIPGRPGRPVPAPGPVGPPGHGPVGARAAGVDHGVDEDGWAWTRPSATATSTRASPAGRRSATRSSSWPSSSPSWPSSTRPTPGSTSTPWAWWPAASRRCARPGRSSGCWSSPTTSGSSSSCSPQFVHLLIDGRIVTSGGPELARRLEEEGYEAWR